MKTPIICAFAVLLVASCARRPNIGTTTTTSAGHLALGAATSRLTTERCNRELACNRIGQDREFADYASCARALDRDTRGHLRADLCPDGVDDGKLSSCLAEVSSKRCSNAVDTIEDIPACDRAHLCIVRVVPARDPMSPF
jgi:hypothetical protein